MDRLCHAKTRNSVANQQQAALLYENAFNLKDYKSKVPFSINCFKEPTDYFRGGEYQRTIKRLVELNLSERTNMSITQLMELPRHELRNLAHEITMYEYHKSLKDERLLEESKRKAEQEKHK